MARVPRRIFISSATTDTDWALDLSDHLEKAGLEPWVMAAEILPGSNWSQAAGEALNRADAIVVLVSPEAMKSDRVRHEIQYALGNERFENRLIPVLVKRTPPNDIPWILRDLQWAEGKPDQVARQVVKTLRVSSAQAR
jgi:hypothetical protein